MTEEKSQKNNKGKPSNLTLCLANCQSVNNKTAYLNDFIVSNDLDCVALTETWLSSDNNQATLKSLIPNGYQLSHVPREVSRGGGVGFLHKDQYNVRTDNSYKAPSFESMTTLLDCGSYTFTFVVICRIPPSKKNRLLKSQFITELADFIELTINQPGRLVISGDFNIHWDSEHDSERKQLNSLLQSFDLVQHVMSPTHEDGHTLDLVITRAGDQLVSSCDVGEFVSDHNAVLVSLNCCRQHPPKREISYRSMKSLDIPSFIQDIGNSPISDPLPTDLDAAVSLYDTTLRSLLDKHAPVKTRSVVNRPSPSPWMNETILETKRARRKAEKNWKKSGLTIHRQIYKGLCQRIKQLIRKAKAEHYKKKIEECEGDQKKLYQIVDDLMGREQPNILPTAPSDLALAEKFNSFFTSKIAMLRDSLNELESTVGDMSIGDIESLHRKWSTSLDVFRPTNDEEVATVIKKSSKASCSLDPIPTPLLKEVLPHVCPLITAIINISFSTGVFPTSLKTAIVQPLIKKATLDKEILKNYRPVSNIPFLSKVIEKVIAKRLIDHMRENQLLDKMQSAYKEAHSTETALVRVQNDILASIDKGKGVFVVLLDLSAAFDTVDHVLLINFLKDHVGIRGPALNLLSTYLTDRSQRVCVNGIFSEMCKLSFGVPQGSVLGPIAFCTYTLPLGTILREHGLSYHIYADDTQVYCTFDAHDAQDNLTRVSACIDDIRTWMIRNKLKINDDKTEFLIMRSPNSKIPTENILTIGQSVIKPSTHCRNLGVMIDCNVTMDKHINYICRSAHLQLRNIGRVRHLLSDLAAAQLVHALVTSKLDYCNTLLYGLSASKLQRLQRIQNIAARIAARCSKTESLHITPVLKSLHWLPIKQRILFKLLLLVYKSLNGIAPSYLSELLQPQVMREGLRSTTQDQLRIPRSRLKNYGDRTFQVAGPKEWNSLPFEIRSAKTSPTFKSKLKTFLFRNHFGDK